MPTPSCGRRSARPLLSLVPAGLAGLAALTALTACAEPTTAPGAPAAPGESASIGTAIDASRDPSLPAALHTATTSAPVAPAPVAPGTATTSVTGCTGTAVALTADEARALTLHNHQRAAAGLAAFCVHPALVAAARAHSQDMIARQYFSHTSLDGRTFVTRVQAAGYTRWTGLAENIAWGSGSYGAPDRIVQNWMNSPGHRANILNGNLREIGIGVAAGTYRGYAGARMWTADFGRR